MVRMRKSSLLPMVLLGEIICFGIFYCVGANGLLLLGSIGRSNSERESALNELRTEVGALKEQLYAWEHDHFYKEKVAREQLQMARAGDKIYYL